MTVKVELLKNEPSGMTDEEQGPPQEMNRAMEPQLGPEKPPAPADNDSVEA